MPTTQFDSILKNSQEAFLKYRQVPGEAKARFLEAIATEIEGLGSVLISKAMEETNLPEVRLVSERGRTCINFVSSLRW